MEFISDAMDLEPSTPCSFEPLSDAFAWGEGPCGTLGLGEDGFGTTRVPTRVAINRTLTHSCVSSYSAT